MVRRLRFFAGLLACVCVVMQNSPAQAQLLGLPFGEDKKEAVAESQAQKPVEAAPEVAKEEAKPAEAAPESAEPTPFAKAQEAASDVAVPAAAEAVTASKDAKEHKKETAPVKTKDAKATKEKSKKDAVEDDAKPAVPLTFEAQAKGWEAQLNDIEALVKNMTIPDPNVIDYQRSELRAIRSAAQSENRVAQELFDAKTAMLMSFGEPPAADAPVQEDKKIVALRKQLNDEIANADAKVKRTALITNRAQKILDDFTQKEQAVIRSLLMTRGDAVYSTDFWALALKEYSIYAALPSEVKTGTSWIVLAVAAAVVLSLLYGPVVKWLNAGNQEVQLATRRVPFFVATAASFLLLCVRFDVLSLQLLPAFYQMLSVALLVVLCVGFWRMITGVKFSDPQPAATEEEEAKAYRSRGYWRKVCRVARLATIAAMPLMVVGYVNLASYILVNLFITLFLVALFVIARRAVTLVMRRVNGINKDYMSARHIIILEPVMVLPFAAAALYFWGVTPEVLQNWLDKYSGGIPIGSIVLNLGDLVSAVMVLVILLYVTRLVQWFVGERVMVYANVESSVRNTVHSITGYVGYSIAILTALGTMGINMANLAIVAGALSVGIGFGLQAIFNNFVSGLILLLERPVRVGDWVQVGNIEGNVSRIRVRSTEIKTFQNALVIVPNSMLITEQVMNWTLNDVMGRIEVKVGVAYGSDLALVRKLIYKAAADNAEVRKRPEIRVFMMDFGDSSILFELRCFIRNIENRLIVMSDIRFKIDELFRVNNITIPYPQRVVHTSVSLDEAAQMAMVQEVSRNAKPSKKDKDLAKAAKEAGSA